MAYGVCTQCGELGELEGHHIISRKQQPALIECKINIISLCISCHKGSNGAHGKYLENIQRELKKNFQDKLYEIFDKEDYSLEEIVQALEIKPKAALKIVRLIYPKAGLYRKEDIIRACMGGRLVI